MKPDAATPAHGTAQPAVVNLPDRRRFILGTTSGLAAAGLGLWNLRPLAAQAESGARPSGPRQAPRMIRYNDYSDIWRNKWKWDKVVKGTHTRANCISACAWDVYVKDGIAWREEQAAIYEPSRPDVPDFNPRGCQKGACYSHLQAADSRITHPLKRAGARGEGKWKRIGWAQALDEIADKLIDTAIAEGTESIIFDDGTTNAGFGPDSSGDIRFAEAIQATRIDSWAGVSDMPMGALQTWGLYNCEGTSDDWFRSDYIVVWIGNPVYTRIPEVHFMHEARYRGAKLVVIAPDLNPSTVHADLWLAIKPETDAALGLACAQVMIEEGLFKRDYVLRQTDLPFLVRQDNQRFLRQSDLVRGGADNALYLWDEATARPVLAPGCEGDGSGGRSLRLGDLRPALSGSFSVTLADGNRVEVRTVFDRLRAMLDKEYRPEQAAAVTGLNPQLIRRFAREMAAAPAAMIFASWGACKHYHSDLFQRAMLLLMNLTGNQGKPGGGMRIASWWGMDGLDAMTEAPLSLMDKLRLIPKALRGLTPRDYEQIFTEISNKSAITPLMVFLYVHGGYKDMWDQPHLRDPALPRPLSQYLRESLDRGWMHVHPAENRPPRAYIFTGCNPLRRWPSPQIAREKLWPKLDLVVSVNFRMSTSGMFADYVLPVAGYYEKYGIKYGQSYVPYIICSDKATEPLGEAKSDWEVFGLLSKHVAERAKARGIGPVRGYRDRPLDLSRTYARHTSDGKFDPTDPEDPLRLMDLIFANSPNVAARNAREALRLGAVPVTAHARPSPISQNYSDFAQGDTYWPHRDFVEKQVAWPTLTGRQQFYLDHPWFIEGGESLPVHKAPPHASSKYPLRINGGHNRWSIHAIWRDLPLMLRLERGQPVCLMNPADTAARGIQDGDMVRVFNDHGRFECMVKVAAATAPGEVIIYHAWEAYQFKNWQGQQEPVEAPWKALHLAGGYSHLHYRMFYGGPSHAPRGAPVEVTKA
jgi:DMSO reductase family type II enzyme molybdopterin subunit